MARNPQYLEKVTHLQQNQKKWMIVLPAILLFQKLNHELIISISCCKSPKKPTKTGPKRFFSWLMLGHQAPPNPDLECHHHSSWPGQRCIPSFLGSEGIGSGKKKISSKKHWRSNPQISNDAWLVSLRRCILSILLRWRGTKTSIYASFGKSHVKEFCVGEFGNRVGSPIR